MVVFVVTINVKIAVVDNVFIIVGSVVISDVGGGDVVVSVRGDGSVFTGLVGVNIRCRNLQGRKYFFHFN